MIRQENVLTDTKTGASITGRKIRKTGRRIVGLFRYLGVVEIGGSNPPDPIKRDKDETDKDCPSWRLEL